MSPEIAEINVLGTGGGYGESIIIHLGNDEWIVIDSCMNPLNNVCLPLSFFESNGIDLKKIKLIVCTHWHDDHIRGLSQIVERATESIFSFARANDLQKFFRLISIDYEKDFKLKTNSSTIEFNKCLEIIKNRGASIKFSEPDRLLYSSSFQGNKTEVFSLSPSDLSNNNFDQEMSKLLLNFSSPSKKFILQKPNDRCVVIFIKLGNHSILLGADLEVNNNNELGWFDIINNSQVIKNSNKSKYFKIPHHGSANSYHYRIWEDLIFADPISTLTPWNRNTKLPKQEMIELYKGKSEKLYITSQLAYVSNKPKKRESKLNVTIKQFNPTIREIRFSYGIISSKINILDKDAKWNTTLEGTAFQVN